MGVLFEAEKAVEEAMRLGIRSGYYLAVGPEAEAALERKMQESVPRLVLDRETGEVVRVEHLLPDGKTVEDWIAEQVGLTAKAAGLQEKVLDGLYPRAKAYETAERVYALAQRKPPRKLPFEEEQ